MLPVVPLEGGRQPLQSLLVKLLGKLVATRVSLVGHRADLCVVWAPDHLLLIRRVRDRALRHVEHVDDLIQGDANRPVLVRLALLIAEKLALLVVDLD